MVLLLISFQMAKLLRVNETEEEKLLWSKLSNKQLGVKFRRQHPLHDFIADLYCHSHRLVIEVDGGIHNTVENRAYDELRSETFTSFGIQVVRFTNNDVIDHTENVIKSIKDRLSSIPPLGARGYYFGNWLPSICGMTFSAFL